MAGHKASRNALAQSANKVVQWVRAEEERIFIIGGAVSLLSILVSRWAGNSTDIVDRSFKSDLSALRTLRIWDTTQSLLLCFRLLVKGHLWLFRPRIYASWAER